MDSSNDEVSVLKKAVDTALIPVRTAVSKPAQRVYLGSFLFTAASFLLLGVSSVAYSLFYYNYVPQNSVERTVYLQFGNGHPQGITTLSSALTSSQSYDVTVFLHLPRTPTNVAAGNFMLDLSLFSPTVSSSTADMLPPSLTIATNSTSVLARSRRPAILTYTSPIVNAASTISGLPWYIMGWKKESEVLEVKMFEGVEFARGWRNVPNTARVIIEADEKMQFYEVGIKIDARFGGLRWMLYNHRIISYLSFTTTFWAMSITSTLIAWLILSSYFSSSSTPKHEPNAATPVPTKSEPSDSEIFDPFSTEDLSDASRSFPTLGRQMPLHYSARINRAKKEEDDEKRIKLEEEEEIQRTTGLQPLTAEADDEDDEGEMEGPGWRDSGLGTSLEEGERRGVQRRRKGLEGWRI